MNESSTASVLSLLYRSRHVLFATTLDDIRARYVGTAFGLSWAVLYPFLFLGLYALVYSLILRVRAEQYGPIDYVMIIFAGLIPFIGFSEALSASVNSITGNKQLIKNTIFPIELAPVKAVLTSSVSMMIGLLGLLIALWLRGQFYMTQVLIIPLVIFQLTFSVGIGWMLGSLNVFFRDISQAIGIVVLFLMIASPIGYTRDMIPHQLLILAYSNPLFYIIELYREVLVFGVVTLKLWLVLATMAVIAFWIGFKIFSRLKPLFAEYV